MTDAIRAPLQSADASQTAASINAIVYLGTVVTMIVEILGAIAAVLFKLIGYVSATITAINQLLIKISAAIGAKLADLGLTLAQLIACLLNIDDSLNAHEETIGQTVVSTLYTLTGNPVIDTIATGLATPMANLVYYVGNITAIDASTAPAQLQTIATNTAAASDAVSSAISRLIIWQVYITGPLVQPANDLVAAVSNVARVTNQADGQFAIGHRIDWPDRRVWTSRSGTDRNCSVAGRA